MSNTDPLVSVIIPVYNVEKYLDRCLNSITTQSYRKLEIILVDDGSTDSSPQLCERWKEKDARIRVVHKENAGLGFARNTGLEKATGKYISFIDSDDYIVENTYEKLVRRLEETQSDICYFGCDYEVEGKIIHCDNFYPDKVYENSEIREEILPVSFGTSIEKIEDTFSVGSVCCGIYKTSLFTNHGLLFDSERIVLCEDILFTSKLLVNANRICFLNQNLYIYFKNEKSLSHTFREDRFEKSISFYQMQRNLINEFGLNQLSIERAGYSLLINCIVCIRQEALLKNVTYRRKTERVRRLLNSPCVEEVIRGLDFEKFNIKKRVLFFAMKYKLVNTVLFLGRG